MPKQNRDSEFYVSFNGGQNNGLSPNKIAENQTARNINFTLANSDFSPRPKFIEEDLTFDFSGKPFAGAPTFREIWQRGRVQAFIPYETPIGNYFIIVISGVIFSLEQRTNCVRIIEVDGEFPRANQYRVRINWSYGDRYIILFDWPNVPIVIDGLSARRTVPARPEIPKSFLGTFVHNRLFVANAGTEFGASDPVSNINPDAPITFFESVVTDDNPSPAFPNQFFALDYIYDLQNITAMGYLPQPGGQTPTGYGPLYVATKKSIHLFAVNQPRINWDRTQLGTVFRYNYGIIGNRAHVNTNNGVLFQSLDGNIYVLNASSSSAGFIGDRHISREIAPSLRTLNKDLLKYSVMGYYNNRAFVTVKPHCIAAIDLYGNEIPQYAFQAIAVMESENESGLSVTSNPVWVGDWVWPVNVIDFNQLGNDYFFIGTNDNGVNKFYRLDDTEDRDFLDGQRRPVKTRFQTREFLFNNPFTDKKLKNLEVNFYEIKGPFRATIYKKHDRSADWTLYGTIEHAANCDGCCRSYSLSQISFGEPEAEGCSRGTNESDDRLNRAQLMIEIEADDFILDSLRVIIENQPEDDIANNCDFFEESGLSSYSHLSDYDL